MFKNLLTVALRNLFHNKLYSLISIAGLALGIAAAVIIFIVNYSELTWDNHWSDADRIFVVERHSVYGDKVDRGLAVSPSLKQAIEESQLDVELVGRAKHGDASIVRGGEDIAGHRLSKIVEIDPSIIAILNLKALKGSLNEFYNDKQSVIISEGYAKKYFGSENPIGEILTIEKRNLFDIPGNKKQDKVMANTEYRVIAVIADMPQRVSLADNFNILLHYSELPASHAFSWNIMMGPTYIKLKKGVTVESIEKSLVRLVDKYIPSAEAAAGKKTSDTLTLTLLNIQDVHLHSNSGADGAMQRIGMLYGLAAIILLLAAINYINLSTARYSLRQKEIALRKTLGASRAQIVVQFMLESAIIMSMVLFLVLILLEPIIPWLGARLGMQIAQDYFTDIKLLSSIILVILALSLAAGFYPGFYLSRVRPAHILKANKSYEMIGSAHLRYGLIVVQFVISAAMLVCVGVIATQIHRALNYHPGYANKNIIYLTEAEFINASYSKRNTLKNSIAKLDGVKSVAQAAFGMGITSEMNTSVEITHLGQSYAEGVAMEAVVLADGDEMKLLDIPLLAGNYFEYSYPVDANPNVADEFEENEEAYTKFDKVILNPEAVTALGFESPAEAIGAQVNFYWNEREKFTRTVIGVSGRVHTNSRRDPPHPVIFWFSENSVRAGILGVAITEHANRDELLRQAKEIWLSQLGRAPGDENIEAKIEHRYSNEIMFSGFIYIFSALAIIISGMGLYGLALFSAAKRTKEICLRKVHGASVYQIVWLLLRQFTRPVVIANLIAWPIALYAMSRWLENFNQRVDLWLWGPVYCLAAGALSVAIAWLTVAGRAFKVARANPAGALREE